MREFFSMQFGVKLVAAVVLILPPIILWKYPAEFTPTVATLLNAILFVLALYIGRLNAIASATRKANAKWLPQAASACSRLLTVWASVRTFRSELSSTCANATQELPELQEQKLRAVKTMLNSHCNHGSARLNDVANHLEDALEDWQRFIGANCEGAECKQITSQIDRRRQALEEQFLQSATTCDQATLQDGAKQDGAQ